MKPFLAICLAASLFTVTPAFAQFGQTNLLPQQERDAVRQGRLLSLGEIYNMLRERYRGGQPVSAQMLDGDRYLIRWEAQGRVKELVVSARNGQVLSERG